MYLNFFLCRIFEDFGRFSLSLFESFPDFRCESHPNSRISWLKEGAKSSVYIPSKIRKKSWKIRLLEDMLQRYHFSYKIYKVYLIKKEFQRFFIQEILRQP